jgi:hypothetical protein
LLDCLVLGDSIAVGVGQARPDCGVVAESGISSERYVQSLLAPRQARTVVISLGVNDSDSIATADNLRRLRNAVRAHTVYWLLVGSNRRTRDAARMVAVTYGDRLIDVAPLAGPDHIHPDRAGYAVLAARTGGATVGNPAPTMPARGLGLRTSPEDFRAFPGMHVWNGPANLNGVPVNGPVRR